MVAVEALLQVLVAKAASGHLPSLRYFFELYRSAIQEHYDEHSRGAFEQLEGLERIVQLSSEPVSKDLLIRLNGMRAATRIVEPTLAAGKQTSTRKSPKKED